MGIELLIQLVVLNNLLSEAYLTQVYQNQEEKPIEAVYTFPLPSRAVLLGVKITIGERKLQGVVVEISEEIV
ncbi:hypothetical protein PITCH_A580032 [uncultured Desulfobacterium sp.]|uniref:VIT domain-containing protein n=1 Tax=uncultured Desulfobacterium sp. TaxID=201089 RepID=A0A445N168_9BACT|nr:hypothetical protein PITCH_A580032 [uncultured Desulfobacterium sp.]